MSSQYPLIGGASATIVAYQLNKQLNLVKLIERETLPTGMGLNIHLLSKAFILIHKYENTPGNLLTDTILSSFLESLPNRACKPSDARPVCTLTSRSRRATGRTPSRTARTRTASERSSPCSLPTSRSARTGSWPAATVTVSSGVCSVTARRTVPMVRTRTRAVSVAVQ